jgi:hypothetical protein
MCCFATTLMLLGPRAAILIWWIWQPVRWEAAFDSWFWPVAGFLVAPWTTLSYVLVATGGVVGFDWFWIVLGVLADIAFWTGGYWGNRDRVPGSATTA